LRSIVGHPSVREGSQAEIVESAVRLASYSGVAGLDPLAYRSLRDVSSLTNAVCHAVAKPVIVAGSVDRPPRVRDIRRKRLNPAIHVSTAEVVRIW
jgi:hypothetical protein